MRPVHTRKLSPEECENKLLDSYAAYTQDIVNAITEMTLTQSGHQTCHSNVPPVNDDNNKNHSYTKNRTCRVTADGRVVQRAGTPFPPFRIPRVGVPRNPGDASNVGEHRGAKTNFYTQLCGLGFLPAGFLWLHFWLRELNRRLFLEVKSLIMEDGCKTSFHTPLP